MKVPILYTEIPSWRLINTHTCVLLATFTLPSSFIKHKHSPDWLAASFQNRTSCCGFSFKSCRESGDGLMSLRPVAPRHTRIIRHRCFFRLALIAYTLNTVTSLTARPRVPSNGRQDVERASVWELNSSASSRYIRACSTSLQWGR